MLGKLGDSARLRHIFDAIIEIEIYLTNTSLEEFNDNSMARFATVKQLEIIGEASKHLSEEIKLRFSAVEWKQIIGMRNVLVHEYFGIDNRLIWQIIKEELPDLKEKIKEIIDAMNQKG